MTPVLLFFYLPQAAPDIVDVVRRSLHESPNLGDWCTFGCLDPSKNGSEFYGARQQWQRGGGSSSAGDPPAPGGADDRSRAHRSEDRGGVVSNGGKLEKSVISFILAHRLTWSVSEGDEELGLGRPAEREPREPRDRHGDEAHASAREVAIPLQELAPGAPRATPSPPPSPARGTGGCAGGALDGCSDGRGNSGLEVWGYPDCALRLLHDLEEFQEREWGSAPQPGGAYALLPPELLSLERIVPAPGSPPVAPLLVGGPLSPNDDGEQGNWGSHFFWLEVLYDFHSGRHASHLVDGGGFPCYGRSAFELLERESSTNAVHTGDALAATCRSL